MTALLKKDTAITDSVLRAMAHMPTLSLGVLIDDTLVAHLSAADFMRIAVYLAEKSLDEGGCPIGAVIVDNDSGLIVGKGHNTLVQENHPYNHGETAAIKDAGRRDFSRTTLYTSLSPCVVCATLLYMRGFGKVVVGDVTNASGTEALLQEKGVQVVILEDVLGIKQYARFRREHPEQDLEDWQGVSAVQKTAVQKSAVHTTHEQGV
ncbi:nucleoside deaminase [Oceanisphaera sp. W20_SRM_FM3]|uniref:nucleoside deaminase n=1 Tax=Oceanisphaera sp. W20_SRM_FM3 TaxID=3240267 RepID=UPI003F970BE4